MDPLYNENTVIEHNVSKPLYYNILYDFVEFTQNGYNLENLNKFNRCSTTASLRRMFTAELTTVQKVQYSIIQWYTYCLLYIIFIES